MNFELGKKYIVEVTEKGIIPREVFLEERYIDKDFDDLDFLTDEEKVIVINYVLDKISTEIEQEYNRLSATRADETLELGECLGLKMSLKIIDKYKAEGEPQENEDEEQEECGDYVYCESLDGDCCRLIFEKRSIKNEQI